MGGDDRLEAGDRDVAGDLEVVLGRGFIAEDLAQEPQGLDRRCRSPALIGKRLEALDHPLRSGIYLLCVEEVALSPGQSLAGKVLPYCQGNTIVVPLEDGLRPTHA
ncbi:MAG: hypothetical protein ACE5JM_09195 [Armatimonadota bacterium]